jgi:hypothetical protein
MKLKPLLFITILALAGCAREKHVRVDYIYPDNIVAHEPNGPSLDVRGWNPNDSIKIGDTLLVEGGWDALQSGGYTIIRK